MNKRLVTNSVCCATCVNKTRVIECAFQMQSHFYIVSGPKWLCLERPSVSCLALEPSIWSAAPAAQRKLSARL